MRRLILQNLDVVWHLGKVWDNLVIVFTIVFLFLLYILMVFSTVLGVGLAFVLALVVLAHKGCQLLARRFELDGFDL